MPIHPTAIIDRRAEIDETASIGAYAIVEAGVKVGPRCVIYPHAYLSQGAALGEDVQVHPFAVVGHHPQDLAWKNTPSYAVIGDGTIIREHATVHRGTPPETTTVLGKRCFLMTTSHVGHNCVLGDDVKLANSALLSGWVQVGSGTFVSGNVGVHQFVRIGELVMVAGANRVTGDVPPFMTVFPHGVTGPNVIGLRRAGMPPEQRSEVRLAHRLLYRSGLPIRQGVERFAEVAKTEAGRKLLEFMRAPSKRGYQRLFGGRSARQEADEEL